MDPNLEHRSNQAGHKLRTKEDRQAHGEETFSDDDGARETKTSAVDRA